MADHALHELHVRRRVPHPRLIGRLVGGDDAARLARRAWLADLRGLPNSRRVTRPRDGDEREDGRIWAETHGLTSIHRTRGGPGPGPESLVDCARAASELWRRSPVYQTAKPVCFCKGWSAIIAR